MNHLGNANQNNMQYHFKSTKMAIIIKKTKQKKKGK